MSGLLYEIIALNRDRILSRLQSRDATRSRRKQEKPPVITRLAETVSTASALEAVKAMSNIALMALKAETKVLKVTFQQLEAMPVNQAWSLDINKILFDLLTCAYTLALRDNLVTSVDAIPNCGKFGPATSSVLRTTLGKLGRYYSA